MADATPSTALLVPAHLRQRHDDFVAAHAASGLAAQGVPLPTGAHFWAMMLLWENLGNPVSQQDLVNFYIDNALGFHYDRQVRHKAAAGWPLGSSSSRAQNMQYCPSFPRDSIALLHMDHRNPIVTANRTVSMTCDDWEAKVALFEQVRGGCGMCGRKCDRYDRGHLDRHQPLSLDNTAPLCPSCNNWLQAVDQNAYVEAETLVVRPAIPGSRRHDRMNQKALARRKAAAQ